MQRLTSSVALLSRPSRPPQTTLQQQYPGKAELLQALPAELTRFNPVKAWGSLGMSLGLSVLATAATWKLVRRASKASGFGRPAPR